MLELKQTNKQKTTGQLHVKGFIVMSGNQWLGWVVWGEGNMIMYNIRAQTLDRRIN